MYLQLRLKLISDRKFELKHDAGTLVATTRGPNPETTLEFMPLAVRLGMKIMWAGKDKAKLVASKQVRELLEKATIAEGSSSDSDHLDPVG